MHLFFLSDLSIGHEASSRLEARKLIDRAKEMIMAQRQVIEDEAYRSLRKVAMTANKKLIDVSREVIAVMKMMQE